MRQLICLVGGFVLLGAAGAWGQQPALQPPRGPVPQPAAPQADMELLQSGSMSPEAWLYLQEYRRWNDPQEIRRRRAQQQAAERRMRLSAMAWYGYSNQRPVAHPTPFTASYSPSWIGSPWNPYHWMGVGAYPRVIVVDVDP